MAIWIYMPSGHGKHFFCDDCVPRGCSCNVRNVKTFKGSDSQVMWWTKEEDVFCDSTCVRSNDSYYYELLDEYGRRSPCSNFECDEEGIDVEETIYKITFNDFVECLWHNKNRLHISQEYAVNVAAYQRFISEELEKDNKNHYYLLDYNGIMCVFYDLSEKFIKDGAYNFVLNRKFYESFKNELRSRRVKN